LVLIRGFFSFPFPGFQVNQLNKWHAREISVLIWVVLGLGLVFIGLTSERLVVMSTPLSSSSVGLKGTIPLRFRVRSNLGRLIASERFVVMSITLFLFLPFTPTVLLKSQTKVPAPPIPIRDLAAFLLSRPSLESHHIRHDFHRILL
jgi:hypothetical protein